MCILFGIPVPVNKNVTVEFFIRCSSLTNLGAPFCRKIFKEGFIIGTITISL